MEAVPPSCDGVDETKQIQEQNELQLVGVPKAAAADVAACNGELFASASASVDVQIKHEGMVQDQSGGKRKRGRPTRAQPRPPAKKMKMKLKEEDEDVCFICFDGGSLVLCDRRGCPKAYHPSCVKREEAFFRSKSKWNCGWHICSICQRSAHYFCYTCTYSLCKACTINSDYLCVRENKGFCATCMKTIMLIENKEQRDKEMAQVDFDDKSSWEYLFKMYWLFVKGKLSLTLDELIRAKQPLKAGNVSKINKSNHDPRAAVLENPSGCQGLDEKDPTICCSNKQSKILDHNQLDNKLDSNPRTVSAGSAEWASKELLEFVSYLKNGDLSEVTQFDVQSLLLDYVKRNNLRDPRRKSHVTCDARLVKLFGKPQVGHVEMLKLLDFHFLVKDENKKNPTHGISPAAVIQAAGNGDTDGILAMSKDKKRKSRKKGEERGHVNNLDEYAAIDAHNISLIYLSRRLMETLINDSGKFHDIVVGSVVRIRISCSDQKQDIYRLVQVVGTSKAAVPYKIGDRAVDLMLDVLNLDKKETFSIEAISNQEISEDECRRLRQSIKCGLVKRLTVGQLQEKALALREVKLNDWMEAEVLRLNHLIDRANEKGRKKELRECIQKLELLKTPKERQRKLEAIPVIHADPNMNPNYNSDDDGRDISFNKQADHIKTRYNGYNGKGRGPLMSRHTEKSIDSRHKSGKDRTCKKNKNGATPVGFSNQALVRSGSLSGVASSATTVGSVTNSPCYDSETLKFWHYRDPNGKVQGPFCMVQLRKWGTSGYFPSDMRVWSLFEDELHPILLNDLLKWSVDKLSSMVHEASLTHRETDNIGGLDNIEQGRRCVESCRPESSSNASIGNSDLYSGFGSESLPKPIVVPPRRSYKLDIPNLPSPTPENERDVEVQSPKVEQMDVHISPDPDMLSPIRDQCKVEEEKSTGDSKIPKMANEWVGYSPTPAKPPRDGSNLDSDTISSELLISNVNCQISEEDSLGIPPSPSSSGWQAIVPEPIDINDLVEPSVSDLLAEVDAMEESRGGLITPTSATNFVEDLFGSLSPQLDSEKNDDLISMEEMQLPPPPDLPIPSRSLDDGTSSHNRSNEQQPSASPERDNRLLLKESVSNGQNPSSTTDVAQTAPYQNRIIYNGWGPPRHRGERAMGSRENWAPQAMDHGLGRGRQPWSSSGRQQSFGSSSSGYSKTLPNLKGQRLCKFYESGHCKKGAYCDFLHPS